MKRTQAGGQSNALSIGWAEADITPDQTVYIQGQLYVRLSEEILDRLTATALVIGTDQDYVVFVSCDLISISDNLRDAVYAQIRSTTTEIEPGKIVLHATHTHASASTRPNSFRSELPAELQARLPIAMDADSYIAEVSQRISQMILAAWEQRTPGGVAYGQSYAVVGRNRRWVNESGASTMYGLHEGVRDSFRHVEGYEDHSLNLLATYDRENRLTGLVINVPSPSQEEEHLYELSADYWYETRAVLRERYGPELFILPQCSAAGDLTTHLLYEQAAHERMLQLKSRTSREEVAYRIAAAVDDVLPYLEPIIEHHMLLRHQIEHVSLRMNPLTERHVQEAQEAVGRCQTEFEGELAALLADPVRLEQPRLWYRQLSAAYMSRNWHRSVIERYERQQQNNYISVPVHVIRLGDIVFASNPYEYYLDFGIQIKVRSAAVQTFLIQLAGGGSYVPSPRSVQGGGYGSVPASNVVGPEGGQQLADYTIQAIAKLWGR